MLQHEHIGLDDHGSSWDECRHKVCGRNTPPGSYQAIFFYSQKKKKKTEFSANANLNNNKKNCGWMQCESVK